MMDCNGDSCEIVFKMTEAQKAAMIAAMKVIRDMCGMQDQCVMEECPYFEICLENRVNPSDWEI